MASVFQLKDGRWCVDHRPGANPENPKSKRTYFGRGSSGEVSAWQFFNKRGLAKGKKAQSHKKTFFDLTSHYLLIKSASMRDSSYETAVTHIDSHLAPYFKDIQPLAINSEIISSYINHRKTVKWMHGNTPKTGVSISTIKREITTLNSIINVAVESGLLSFNPIRRSGKPRDDNEIIRPPSQAELSALLKHSPEHLRRFILLSYYTGARPGKVEILSITWDDTDMIEGVIHVRSAHKGGLAVRQVSMHDVLKKLMPVWYDADNGSSKYIINYQGQRINSILHSWNNTKKTGKDNKKIATI